MEASLQVVWVYKIKSILWEADELTFYSVVKRQTDKLEDLLGVASKIADQKYTWEKEVNLFQNH